MALIFSLMAVNSLPSLPAGGNVLAASYCPLSHVKMVSTNCVKHVMAPTMRHCRMECCGHHDIDGLPHLLAPHAISLADFDISLVMMDVVAVDIPVLKPRLLPFPVPPPRISLFSHSHVWRPGHKAGAICTHMLRTGKLIQEDLWI